MYDVDEHGIGGVMNMAIKYLQDVEGGEKRPIHLSYDIDAIDPESAPATGTRVRGGLTFREAHFVAERVYKTGMLSSADLVELNPSLSDDKGGKDTVDLGKQIITSFMGKAII
jgi:arginase